MLAKCDIGRFVTTTVAGEPFVPKPLSPRIAAAMPPVTRLLSITKPTAGKAIEVLTRAGILTEIGARKRDRLYRYHAYLQLMD